MFSRFQGYHPDIDEATPGLIVDGENIIPSPAGYRSAYQPVNGQSSALTATCVGAASFVSLSGDVLTYAGTSTQLYKEDGDHWTAVTRSAGDYTAGAAWEFAQYGNATYAANDVSQLQTATTGVFADVSGAPASKIIIAVQNQLIAMNTVDGTFGDSGNRWWCSALGNADSWVPSIATQAASGQLVDTPGEIIAGMSLGERAVAYKKESMYLGTYIGPPSTWQWPLISDEIGCVGPKAVVQVNSAHYFMGTDDFYVFDGTYPRGFGGTLKEFFFQDEINNDYIDKSIAVYEKLQGLVYFLYVSKLGTGSINSYIAYHVTTQKWGPPTAIMAQTAFTTTSAPITYEILGDLFLTYDDLPSISYDSAYWTAIKDNLAIFNSSNRLQTLSEAASSMSISTWSMGADEQYSFLSRLRPRFKKAPLSGTMVNCYQEDHGGTWVTGATTSTLNNGKFDVQRESRWHKLRMDFTGDTEIVGLDVKLEGAGYE